MLDYFQDPFVAPNDYNVMASVANVINNSEVQSAIAQAPHHFEIWRIATVDDQGHIHESRDFIADASSLVRTGREPPESGTPTAAGIPLARTGGPTEAQHSTSAHQQTPRYPLAPKSAETVQARHTAEGGNN